MSDFAEKEAKTVEEARQAVAEELGLPPEEIEFEVLDEGSKGLFGLRSRPARVRGKRLAASAEEAAAAAPQPEEAPSPEEKAPESAAAPAPAGPAGRGKTDGKAAAKGVELLTQLVGYLSDKATVESRETSEGIFLDIVGDDSGLLIGRRGQTLDALQHLVNKMVGKARTGAGPDPRERIIVDASQYRERRRTSLEEMAVRMAQKVRETGKAVSVEPLPPHERRILHLILEKEPGVSTRSMGEGEYRRLRILPAGRGGRRRR